MVADHGPAEAALARMVTASFEPIAGSEGFVRRASEGARHRPHGALIAPLEALVPRGRAEHAFRSDVPVDWRPPITPRCTTPRARRR